MKKIGIISVCIMLFAVNAAASLHNPYNLLIAPGTLTDNSVTLLWDKAYSTDAVVYEIFLNNKLYTATGKTNITISGLIPGTTYSVGVHEKINRNKLVKRYLYLLKFKTPKKGKRFNILDYGARADSLFKNTTAIQKAIDACTAGGTVYIPKGIFLSGAIF